MHGDSSVGDALASPPYVVTEGARWPSSRPPSQFRPAPLAPRSGFWNVPFDEEEAPELESDIGAALAASRDEVASAVLAQVSAALGIAMPATKAGGGGAGGAPPRPAGAGSAGGLAWHGLPSWAAPGGVCGLALTEDFVLTAGHDGAVLAVHQTW